MYGRQVRGPLDIIKESWEVDKRSSESVVSHAYSSRQIIQDVGISKENFNPKLYKRNGMIRMPEKIQAGVQVLVLLPSTTNKLYPVTRQITPVTYEVDMFDHKKRKRILHVNMLKKWSIPTLALWTEANNDTDGNDDELPSWKDDTALTEKPKMGTQLSTGQMRELQKLLESFSDIMNNYPGKTDLIKHEIHISSHPICLPPQELPAYKDMVQQELSDMLSSGIIEPSKRNGPRLCWWKRQMVH